ncbi:hypothetical protein QUF94_10515 [Peribacillus sp. NJ4]|uniref:hypothetical protein n=1 Tax=Peribacillus sp. NJ4 TaxID=3055862 RepID=UPI0025A10A01|nr:hypothetical protein [Peribacillus sp. NJ4]MDM5211877.1 hypothetical protein [Peribacillus sp. NJ4]
MSLLIIVTVINFVDEKGYESKASHTMSPCFPLPYSPLFLSVTGKERELFGVFILLIIQMSHFLTSCRCGTPVFSFPGFDSAMPFTEETADYILNLEKVNGRKKFKMIWF